MTKRSILVAGIGNIFRGDDAFGVEVVQRLGRRALREQVRLDDFGIRSYDLAFALLDGYDTAILVDATSRGGRPGTLYTIEIDTNRDLDLESSPFEVDSHVMNPVSVLRMARMYGGPLPRILLVACEPLTLGSEEEGRIGLSEPVLAAVDEAVRMVDTLLSQVLAGETVEAAP